MNWRGILMLFVLAIFVAVLASFFGLKMEKSQLVLGGKTFNVEVADKEALQVKGLSGHKPLLDNEGMLFVFPKLSNYGFWMKDMLFSIDIIWISDENKIVWIEKSLSPQTYPKVFGQNVLSKCVLEISAGQVGKLNVKIGDELNFIKNNP